jgi:hypothetical protein
VDIERDVDDEDEQDEEEEHEEEEKEDGDEEEEEDEEDAKQPQKIGQGKMDNSSADDVDAIVDDLQIILPEGDHKMCEEF